MAGGELRRSYTQMDFSLNRVNIRPQLPHLFHQQPPLHQVCFKQKFLFYKKLWNQQQLKCLFVKISPHWHHLRSLTFKITTHGPPLKNLNFMKKTRCCQELKGRDPRRRYSAMPAGSKVKHPTLDIYRPPSIRHEGANNGMAATWSLNVNAPEFHMNKIQNSRSTSNVMMNGYGMMAPHGFPNKHLMQQPQLQGKVPGPGMHPLQLSKSSGNVLHAVQPHVMAPNIVQQTPQRAVHFQDPVMTAVPSKSGSSGLKRSKSLSATDALRAEALSNPMHSTDPGSFSVEVQADLKQAVTDPNAMSARALMTLAKLIVERATSNRLFTESSAKVCINVIEKEKKETFLESLINTIQLSYQERTKVLRNPSFGSRYPIFIAFLNEMYVQLKRSQLQFKTQYDGVPPQLLLLTLLSKCFVDCLQNKPLANPEIEAIFFAMTSIGRDLEQDLPKAMEQVFANIRDVFLYPSTKKIKSTFLQLIELRASKWQMPASAVVYYYPRIGN